MTAPGVTGLRCLAMLFRSEAVPLVHRPADRPDDWVLPGGSPGPGDALRSAPVSQARSAAYPGDLWHPAGQPAVHARQDRT